MKDFLFTLAVLLVVARVFGEVARKLHQPAVLGELTAGLLLGPSFLGWLAPSLQSDLFGPSETLPRLTTLSVCFLLAVTGLEIDLPLIGRRARTAAWLSGGGLLVPLALGFGWGWLMPEALRGNHERFLVASFVAVALAISAIPVVATVLLELGALRTPLGQLILAAAMLDDAVGWILLSVVAGFAQRGSGLDFDTVQIVFLTLSTLAVSLTVGPRWMSRFVGWSNSRDPGPRSQLSLFLLCMILASCFTEWIGLEPGFGAFLLGVVAGQSRRFSHQVLETVELMTVSFFSPLFFATAGLKVDLPSILQHPIWLYTLSLVVVASVGKFLGCYLGGKAVGLARSESLVVGAGLNPRGAMGVIVATLGLKLGVIETQLYSMLVAMALITSLLAPPILRYLLGKLETTEPSPSHSFSAGIRRILLPTAGGTNSRLAASMLDAVSGGRELELTTLKVGNEPGGPILSPKSPTLHVKTLHRKLSGSVEETVLDEAHLDYHLVVLGAGQLEGVVDRILQATPCPTLVVRGPSQAENEFRPRSILLPVVGSQYSRHAVDLCAWWARTYASQITLLHVIPPEGDQEMFLPDTYHQSRRDFAERLLDGCADLLRRDGLTTDTLILEHIWPEKAIVEELNGKYDLVIMGTNMEPLSGRAYLGHCVEHVLQNADPTVMVLSSS